MLPDDGFTDITPTPQGSAFILETSVGRGKDMLDIGVHGETEKIVVIAKDGVNAENAGAISCHLAGDESFFCFTRCAKSLHVLP